MNFLNPLVLIGLIGASIPVILHLLNLRKLKKIEFSSLKFIKELRKTKIKRVKLKQILLLILRTLAIIFAVLAFSRPTIKGTISGFESFAKTGAVIIVDNSYSMDANTGSGNSFRNAIAYAGNLVDFFKEGDEALIMPLASHKSNRKMLNFSTNKANLKKELREIDIAYSKVQLEKALFDAISLLQDSKNINKEIYILTDSQKINFIREFADSLKTEFSPTVYFIPVSEAGKIENLAIDSVRVETNIFEMNAPVNLSFEVTNFGTQKVENSVANLYFNGKKSAQRTFDIEAGETKSIAISAPYNQSGFVEAVLELEADELDADNTFNFGFIISDAPKVAVFSDFSSSDFLRAALEVIPDRYSLEYYKPEELNRLDLNKYDVVIYNGKFLSPGLAQTLNSFISAGKAALIFAPSDRNDTGNAYFLGSYETSSIGRAVPINEFEQSHPFFKGVFNSGNNNTILEAPEITNLININQGSSLVKVLGKPLLSELKIGEGKVLYLSLPPTLDAGSFPITSLFPAVVNRAILYLKAKEENLLFTSPGSSITIELDKRFAAEDQFKILDPNKVESFTYRVSLPSGEKLVIGNTEIPGSYKITNSDGKAISIFSVNPITTESDLAVADEEQIERFVNSIAPDASVNFAELSVSPEDSITRVRLGTELWKFFVAATLLCLLLEMIVARVSRSESEE